MNRFEIALEDIKKDFPVRKLTNTYAQIEFDILFDAYNYIFIGVLFEDDNVILTDCADYAEICPLEDIDYPEVERICAKHGIKFNNWHIECLYESNKDIKNYLDCLLELKEKYVID